MGKLNIEVTTVPGSGTQVRLSGVLDEKGGPELLPKVHDITSPCHINLADIEAINSIGSMAWIRFITLLGQKTSQISLEDCSVEFICQANMIDGFEGVGKITSFYAEFSCEQCPHEEKTLIDSSTVFKDEAQVEKWLSHPLVCKKCGSSMQLMDDIKFFVQRESQKIYNSLKKSS